MWGKINGEERLYDPGNVICVVLTSKFQQERAITQKKRANEQDLSEKRNGTYFLSQKIIINQNSA